MSEATVGSNGSEATTAVIQRSAELEQTDWRGAIDMLLAANRTSRSDEVETALAALRHRSAGRVAVQPTVNPPLAPGDCPPIGESGLPETTLAGLTAATVRAAILSRGSLIVRGAVDPERAQALAESIDQSFCAADAGTAGPSSGHDPDSRGRGLPSGDAALTAWWSMLDLEPEAAIVLGRKWVRAGGGVLICDSPRMLFEVLDLYTQLGLEALVADYLGSQPVLSGNKGTLRRVPLDAVGGWHQDGAFLGSGIQALNLWLTLTPCGVDAPGLDLVPHRFDEIVETGTGGSYFDWAVGPEVIAREGSETGLARPLFDAGDLVIFDDLNLHRTAIEPEMTRERHAIELWCFAPEAYPENHVPLVW